jgi:predicted transcriptional regulator
MKYRSRADIIATILQGTAGGATRTRLMYKAYLSYTQVKEYVEFLQARALITSPDETQTLHLTEKGLNLLHLYNEIGEYTSLGEKGVVHVPQRDLQRLEVLQ